MFASLSSSPEAWKQLHDLQVPIATRRECLHALVEGIYRGTLTLLPDTAEEMLRIAELLGMDAISSVCQQYLTEQIVQHLPAEVCHHSTASCWYCTVSP